MLGCSIRDCISDRHLPKVTRRTFVGPAHLRLHVVASDRMMPQMPATLRELNFIEPLSGSPATPSREREVYLIDGSLPEAFDLCRALPEAMPKILATTRSGFDHRKLCVDCGVDAVINDPVEARELADWLEHFGERHNTEHAAVLIVDDDELAADAVAALLSSRGITAETVTNPTRIFEALERHPFDLVLMDLNMPEANGIDVARMIRQDRRYLSLPVVFLASDDDTETQMRARRFGGDDFISKRIDPALLLRLVELRVDRARVLRTLIERDGLTGLMDHQRFIERLSQELARSRRNGTECTLAMLDLDHFKLVNDTWGHLAGDLVLRRLAAALTAWLRQTDVVGRYGGEEFAVLLLDTTPAQAAPVIDAFRRNFSALDIAVPGGSLRTTFSVGIAGARNADDATALISAADAALYRAKSEGRNSVVIAELERPAEAVAPKILPSAPPARLRRVNRLIRAGARRTDGADDASTSP